MNQWRKPTQAEALLGFVAMTPRVYYCYTDKGILTLDYKGRCKENGLTYLQAEAWGGYTQIMLERRASWSEDIPEWFQPTPIVEATIETFQTAQVEAPKPLEADWYAYLDGKEASAELGEKLKSLGSYEGKAA